jgi:hypothetical protein
MKTILIECPDELHEQLEKFVGSGWAADVQQATVEALRRFLDAHAPALIEDQVMRDVEWGLHGNG